MKLESGKVNSEEMLARLEDVKNLVTQQLQEMADMIVYTEFPVDTGELRDSVLFLSKPDSIQVVSTAPHAMFVEQMVGVNWKNPLAQDHPHARLKLRLAAAAPQIIKDALKTFGFDVE